MNKNARTIIRTALFLIIGLMNTVFIRTEDVGSIKNYLGYLFLLVALIDAIFLIKKLVYTKHESK